MMTLLWWILGSIFFIGAGACVDEDHWGWGTILTALIIAGFCSKYGINLWAYTQLNWGNMLAYAGAYLFIGVMWSMVKFHVKASKINAKEVLCYLPPRSDEKDIDDKMKDLFEDLFAKVPQYIAFWPMLVAWDILSDWLQSFFKWVSQQLKWAFASVFAHATHDAREAAKFSYAEKQAKAAKAEAEFMAKNKGK